MIELGDNYGDVVKWSASTFRECFTEEAAQAIAKKINKNWYINEETGELDEEGLKESIAYENTSSFFWDYAARVIEKTCTYPRRCETITKRFGRRGYKDWQEKLDNGEPYQSDLYGTIDDVEKAAVQALYDYVATYEKLLWEKINRRAYTIIYFYK